MQLGSPGGHGPVPGPVGGLGGVGVGGVGVGGVGVGGVGVGGVGVGGVGVGGVGVGGVGVGGVGVGGVGVGGVGVGGVGVGGVPGPHVQQTLPGGAGFKFWQIVLPWPIALHWLGPVYGILKALQTSWQLEFVPLPQLLTQSASSEAPSSTSKHENGT
jgi:hypothetical protein